MRQGAAPPTVASSRSARHRRHANSPSVRPLPLVRQKPPAASVPRGTAHALTAHRPTEVPHESRDSLPSYPRRRGLPPHPRQSRLHGPAAEPPARVRIVGWAGAGEERPDSRRYAPGPDVGTGAVDSGGTRPVLRRPPRSAARQPAICGRVHGHPLVRRRRSTWNSDARRLGSQPRSDLCRRPCGHLDLPPGQEAHILHRAAGSITSSSVPRGTSRVPMNRIESPHRDRLRHRCTARASGYRRPVECAVPAATPESPGATYPGRRPHHSRHRGLIARRAGALIVGFRVRRDGGVPTGAHRVGTIGGEGIPCRSTWNTATRHLRGTSPRRRTVPRGQAYPPPRPPPPPVCRTSTLAASVA